MSPDTGTTVPGWFIALVVIVVVIGIGGVIWRVAIVRRLARNAGLDPNTAAAVTVLSGDGLGAAYLASTIASPSSTAEPTHDVIGTVEERLRGLDQLKAHNLVSAGEYNEYRRKILDDI